MSLDEKNILLFRLSVLNLHFDNADSDEPGMMPMRKGTKNFPSERQLD